MKKLLNCLLLGVFAVTLCAAGGAAPKFKKPQWVGTKGPKVLLFNGGRPWQAKKIATLLSQSGLRVLTISGQNLNGLAGATFENFVTDKRTKPPIDGITPMLDQLHPKFFQLVVFHQIPAKNMPKILTPENIAKLRNYVENGGKILFTNCLPADLAEDLLPVKLEKSLAVDDGYFADRPTNGNFDFCPKKLPILGSFRLAKAKPEAEVLSMIKTPDGDDAAPYIARIKIGKGEVTFFGATLGSTTSIRSFPHWAYAKPFFAQVVADGAGVKTTPKIDTFHPIPERIQLGEITLDIVEPVLSITDDSTPILLQGNRALFGYGVMLTLADNGAVDITFPGKDKPFIRNSGAPQIITSPTPLLVSSATSETIYTGPSKIAADVSWQVQEMTVAGNELVITYIDKSRQNRLLRHFKSGKMNLDGRIYYGIAEKSELVESPLLVSGLTTDFDLDLPDPLFARRFNPYSKIRGYKDFDMTGRSDAEVAGGQPFKLVVGKGGVYISHPMDSDSLSDSLSRKKGALFISATLHTDFGRMHAPIKTPWQWRYFSDGPERGHQEYLAMYQFFRKIVRQLYGLKEIPAYPIVRVGHNISKAEKNQVIEAAVKAGYRYISIPSEESPIENINRPQSLANFERISALGAQIRIWTAGSYVQGNGGWIINNHPEWFLRDDRGRYIQYGGRYPVIDINNEEFRAWCKSVYKDAIDHGVRWFYRDMDGNTINYAKKESPWAGRAKADIYKFLQDHGARVGKEGLDSRILDEYWYRAHLYLPFTGVEFSLVGQQPYGDGVDGLMLDPMRQGMYGCFMMYEYSGTAFNLDRRIGEVERGRRASSFAPKFNEALDFVGMPYIRESDFGTVWYGKGGAVMFFWNPVKKLTINLPQGWKIRGIEGNELKDIPGDSIIYIDRK